MNDVQGQRTGIAKWVLTHSEEEGKKMTKALLVVVVVVGCFPLYSKATY
jgi:hypothetical protein